MRTAKDKLYRNPKYLNEVKEHTDDEIVDFDEINLRHEFDKLNALIFDNKVIPPMLIWNSKKSAHGTVKARRKVSAIPGQPSSEKIEVVSLGISKFLDVPYKIFKDTLAHEMIHVYLLQNNINDGHGPKFHAEMNRINNLGLGFNVAVTLNSSGFSISKNVKKKDLMLLVFSSNKSSDYMVSVTTPEVLKRDYNDIQETFIRQIKLGNFKWVKAEFYKSENPELQRYTVQRSFKNSLKYNWKTGQEVYDLLEDLKEHAFDGFYWDTETVNNYRKVAENVSKLKSATSYTKNEILKMKTNSNYNFLREEIKRIIREFDESLSLDDNQTAKSALIALSKNQVTKGDILKVYGNLGGADFDEDGNQSSTGEVEIEWMFNGKKFSTILNVTGNFYLKVGSEGYWGASVDDSRAPEPDDAEDQGVEIDSDEIIVSDEDNNEYEFTIDELGSDFKSNMESFLLDRYNALDELIS